MSSVSHTEDAAVIAEKPLVSGRCCSLRTGRRSHSQATNRSGQNSHQSQHQRALYQGSFPATEHNFPPQFTTTKPILAYLARSTEAELSARPESGRIVVSSP